MYREIGYKQEENKGKERSYLRTGGWKWILLCLLPVLLMVSCSPEEAEENDQMIVEKQQDEVSYNLAVVTYGDVLLTEVMRGYYEEMEEEMLSFSVSGRLVSNVYVKEGDMVTKGQLLAELGDSDLSGQVQTLEYQITRNQTLLEQARINEDYDISTVWLQFMYQSGQSEAEREALESRVVEIQQQYRYLREDYQDAIELAQIRLESVKKELSVSKLYAGMTGTVTWIQAGLEGSTARAGQDVIEIKNQSECLFAIEGAEYASLFEDGDAVEMVISTGKQAGIYLMLPYRIDEWTDKLWFAMVDDDIEIEMGTTGTITIVLENRENVLNIPKQAVHTAEGRSFVYCLGEDDMREVKWVETGFEGDDMIEILSGLEEGERVVLR